MHGHSGHVDLLVKVSLLDFYQFNGTSHPEGSDSGKYRIRSLSFFSIQDENLIY